MSLRSAARAAATGLAVLAVACVAVVLPVGAAQAHAVLVDSDPSDGATLATAPHQLHLRLSESVVPDTTKVRVADGTGRPIAVGTPAVSRTATGEPGLIYQPGDAGAPTTITVDLPALPPDVYRISWSTLSSADLHQTSGVVIFGVQRQVDAGANADDPLPNWLEVLLRWLVLVTAGIGAACLVVLGIAGTDLPDGPRRALLRRGAALSAAGAGAGVALILTQAAVDGIGIGRVLSSAYGLRWSVAELAALALAGLCWWRARPATAAHPGAGSRTPVVAGLLVVLVHAGAVAMLGHAGASASGEPVRFVADVAHIGAAQLWVGLLVVAVLLVLDPTGRSAWRPVLTRYRPVAVSCVGVVSVSGLLVASTQVASLDALVVSSYGRLLIAKLSLAALSAVAAIRVVRMLAALHRPGGGSTPDPDRRAGPTPRALRSRVVVEAGLLAGVVLLGAAVASSRPASGPEWVPASAAVPIRSGTPQDLVETVTVSPNLPGRNYVTVDVYQTRRPEPGPVTGVAALLRRAGSPSGRTVDLTQDRAGRWVAPTDDFEAAGLWQVEVVVTRDGVGVTRAGYDWRVADPQARLKQPLLSSVSLRRPLTGAAALVALVVAGAGLVHRRRGRRRPPAIGAPRGPGSAADANPGHTPRAWGAATSAGSPRRPDR